MSEPASTTRRRLARIGYVLCQVTWGLPQTFLGFVMWCFYVRCPHSVYRGAIVTYWGKRSSVSLGLFLFLSRSSQIEPISSPSPEYVERSKKLHAHEYGHSIQSLFLGPFYLLFIGIPSLLWAGFPPLSRAWRNGERGYYSFATERFADYLAARFPVRD